MRLLLALLMLAVSVLPGHAISRYQSTKLTCDAIKERIADEGAVILRYPGRSNPSITVSPTARVPNRPGPFLRSTMIGPRLNMAILLN